MSLIQVSQSAPMQAEAAKQLKTSQSNQTNLQPTAAREQMIHGNPYGKDGMLLSEKEDYHALQTILPNSEMEKARNKLKKETKQKKKKEKKKKKNFWQWLFSK